MTLIMYFWFHYNLAKGPYCIYQRPKSFYNVILEYSRLGYSVPLALVSRVLVIRESQSAKSENKKLKGEITFQAATKAKQRFQITGKVKVFRGCKAGSSVVPGLFCFVFSIVCCMNTKYLFCVTSRLQKIFLHFKIYT